MTLLVAVLALLGSLSASDAIAGTYDCHGIAPAGRYRISLDVARFQNGYRLTWKQHGQVTAKGVGLRRENTLNVAISMGTALAFAEYTIGPGVLDGRWWGDSTAKLPETCSQGPIQEAE